jgi:hypothetical protein
MRICEISARQSPASQRRLEAAGSVPRNPGRRKSAGKNKMDTLMAVWQQPLRAIYTILV